MSAGIQPINEARSLLMRQVRRSQTSAEDCVARSLTGLGVRYRRNATSLPGSPDFSNQSRGWVIFVHGCFWHFHEGCRLSRLPKHNRMFWHEKLLANRARDLRKSRELRRLGLRVATVWQCHLSDEVALRRRLKRLVLQRDVKETNP